ncbi:HNH endonuclease [Bosea sp. 47.2.35]|uniref:HNH endonuclease n=1 Tax=Bosea sp. 47.2.35 TaxID=2969304 RepID=UPI00214F9D5E|nr:HNH endonuclease [Bosea sp. 47.2.35]MCR4524125.1 HNH endonuclease [Bosea sp. 47.2.35]
MRYAFARVVHNDHDWIRPSPHRLNSRIDKGYLAENGYGFEDWNFSKDISSDGFCYGYHRYAPQDRSSLFNLAFATYDKVHGWLLVGWYEGAEYVEAGSNFSSDILNARAGHLTELDAKGSLGGKLSGLNQKQIAYNLRKSQTSWSWKVSPSNMHRLQFPIPVPAEFTFGFGKYFTTAKFIDEIRWNQLRSIAYEYLDKKSQSDYNEGGEVEFPEGKSYQVSHFERERSQKLVSLAKAKFKKKHGRLFCEACGFSFGNVYGGIGDDFIEMHHLIPVSELSEGSKTKLSDVVLVCSNCHRMLHRHRPWITSVDKLKFIMKNAKYSEK